ncbi:MAG: lipopolysaccharide biosynthesis protein [Acidimicrobiales bacterium]
MLHGLRRRASGHRHLLTGSAALVLTAGVQALSGALFWLIAARVDEQSDVGHATALFTSVLFVAFMAGLGQPVAAARYAAGRTRADHVLYAWGAAATAVAAVVFGIGYLLVVSPPAVEELRDWHGAAGPALFMVLCAGTALALLLDVRLMTQRRWGLVLARQCVVGFARFPLLLIPVDTDRAVWLLALAAFPNALSGFLGTAWLRRITGHRHVFRPMPSTTNAWLRYSLVNWASTITYQAPTFAMPVIVLANVTAEDNASFYVAWGVAAVACYVPTAIGQALLAEGGRDGAHVRSQVRLAILVAGGLMVVGAVIATVGRDLIVTLYGADYQDAADILPPLVLAAVPWAVTSVYLTEARVRHRSAATVLITVVLSTAILIPALVLVPEDGIEGAATAFLFGNIVAAVVALGAHLQIRRTADAPIPATSPDEFEPEDAIGLTPTPLT